MSDTNIKAVLVRLSIRIFPNTRQDPEITDEVRAKKSLGLGAGKWVKHVFPEEAFKEIRETGGEARRRHYDLTLPWEEGYRLLPSGAHPGYEKEFETFKSLFHSRITQFERKYDHWIKEAKAMHNGTFNPDLYPDWIVMKKHFEFGVEYSPVPKAAHFVTSGLASEAVAEMKADLEKHNETRVKAAVKDTWNRLLTPVQAMAEKLSGKKPIFRDTLIQNVKEITAMIPALNLTGDATLAKFAKDIETRFASLDADLLRSDAAVRKSACKDAKAIVSLFGKVGKRRFA